MQNFGWIAVFALGSLIVNSFGVYFIYKNNEWADRLKEYFMCFAAGMLITSPLIMTFPEALSKNDKAGFAAIVGFVFMFFSNKYIKHKTHQKELAFGITAVEGIGIHSFVDGIIYTVTFSVSIFTGILSSMGLVIHEFAEGVITYSVLLKGGMSAKKAAFFAFLVAGLTTPIGAFLVYPFINKFSDSFLGLALGFVVGVLIYISAGHLLPEATEYEKKHSNIAFILGVGLAVFIMLLGGD